MLCKYDEQPFIYSIFIVTSKRDRISTSCHLPRPQPPPAPAPFLPFDIFWCYTVTRKKKESFPYNELNRYYEYLSFI